MFQNLDCSENGFIQSLIELLQFENDELQVSCYKLLFAIFHAEKNLFLKAKSSYIITSSSYDIYGWMIELATFFDDDKILLRMLQGDAESGEESVYSFSFSFLTRYFTAQGRICTKHMKP